MTVKEMIIELLNCAMDAKVVVEIPTSEDYKYSTMNDILKSDNPLLVILSIIVTIIFMILTIIHYEKKELI